MYSTESSQLFGGLRCPVAMVLMKSGQPYSSATDRWLIMSSLKQVTFMYHIAHSMHPIQLQIITVLITSLTLSFSDYPNETMTGDSEDPAFFSSMVCCSLASFA